MFATIRASDLRLGILGRYFRMLVVGIARFLLPSIRILLLGLRASDKGMEIDCSCRIALSYALAKTAGHERMATLAYNGDDAMLPKVDCKLSLKTIALQARNAEDNPKRFAAVIRRIGEPKTTTLKFASGKMVCTGAKSEHQLKLAAMKYARIIQKLGFPAKSKDFKIQNIVGSCDVKFPIRLEGLAYEHSQFSSVRDDTYRAFENIYPVLTEYRKIQQWYPPGNKLTGANSPELSNMSKLDYMQLLNTTQQVGRISAELGQLGEQIHRSLQIWVF